MRGVFFRLKVCASLITDDRDSRLRGNDVSKDCGLKTVVPATGRNDFPRRRESMLSSRNYRSSRDSAVAQTLYKFPDKSGRQLRIRLTSTYKAPNIVQLTAPP
jgi:hypothetical protein